MSGNKYKAIPTVVDGVRFDSRKEARRYQQLKLLEKAGEIRDLELQPEYPLHILGKPVTYASGRQAKAIMDFAYTTRAGARVVEDVKGRDNPLSKLKRALVQAIYGVRVEVIS